MTLDDDLAAGLALLRRELGGEGVATDVDGVVERDGLDLLPLATIARLHAPPPRSAGCLGKAWERRREQARAVGMPVCMVQERSAAQRDRLWRLAAVAVDPGVRPALIADQAPVEQVLGHHVAHRGQDGRAHTGMLPFDVRQQLLDALPLEIFLRATEVAG